MHKSTTTSLPRVTPSESEISLFVSEIASKVSQASPQASLLEEERRKLDEILEERGEAPPTLISVLHAVQNRLGYVPIWAQEAISQNLRIPLSKVHGVVTFYNFFSQEPRGRHTIQICQGTACYVRGGKTILEEVERRLGIQPGQTTQDHRFSLQVVRCLGCCGLAPVLAVDGDVYGRMNPERVLEVLRSYE